MDELDRASKRLKTVRNDHFAHIDAEIQKIDVEEKRLRDNFHKLEERRNNVLPPMVTWMHLMMILLKSMQAGR